MSIISLIMGIISIFIQVTTRGLRGFGWIGAFLAIAGIVLGVKGKNESDNEGMAIAGIVCSIIGLILFVILFAYWSWL